MPAFCSCRSKIKSRTIGSPPRANPSTAVQDQINSNTKPGSFAFPAALHVNVDVHIDTLHATVNNVLAYLPGKTDEYVIVGAHYDHLGYGNADSLAPSQIGQIHPGADDNASGTSGVLELARLFAPLKGQLPRGILFMSFAGEELGLLGSAHWTQQPTHPLDKAVAMINMDMIGRIKDEKVYVGGVGTGSTFQTILNCHAEKFAFSLRILPGRVRGQRPHFFCRAQNSGAFLFLRIAFRLSQAV